MARVGSGRVLPGAPVAEPPGVGWPREENCTDRASALSPLGSTAYGTVIQPDRVTVTYHFP